MSEPAAIFEMDVERDRKACVALDLKVTGANRELAQWLLDHPRYSGSVVAGWLGCGSTRIKELRVWAQGGFVGKHYQSGKPPKFGDGTLESLDNLESEDDDKLESAEIAEPAEIEDNALYTIQRMNEHARIFRKLFKVSPFDRETKDRINTAIERMIQKWRSVQSTLTRSHDDGKA